MIKDIITNIDREVPLATPMQQANSVAYKNSFFLLTNITLLLCDNNYSVNNKIAFELHLKETLHLRNVLCINTELTCWITVLKSYSNW